MTHEAISRLRNDALDAFWQVVGSRFTATTGDLDPGVVFDLDNAADQAIEAWIDNNVAKSQRKSFYRDGLPNKGDGDGESC